jgi:hypothetical protein
MMFFPLQAAEDHQHHNPIQPSSENRSEKIGDYGQARPENIFTGGEKIFTRNVPCSG